MQLVPELLRTPSCVRRGVRRAALSLLAIPWLAATLAPASAATIVVTSQTGSIGAGGETHTLGLDRESFAVSGLDDQHLVASVEAGNPAGTIGTPPGYYKSTAQLHTDIDDTRIVVSASTSAAARWDGFGDPFFWEGTEAVASMQLTITFDLAEDTLVRAMYDWNSPVPIVLENTALGFRLEIFDSSGWYTFGACGPLSSEECGALLHGLGSPSGGLLPAGSWTLSGLRHSSRSPVFGSCAIGCAPATGSFSLTVVPEPGTLALVTFGSAGLAAVRRRQRT